MRQDHIMVETSSRIKMQIKWVIFMQIWVHLQIHHLRVGKIPMEDGNIKTLTEVM